MTFAGIIKIQFFTLNLTTTFTFARPKFLMVLNPLWVYLSSEDLRSIYSTRSVLWDTECWEFSRTVAPKLILTLLFKRQGVVFYSDFSRNQEKLKVIAPKGWSSNRIHTEIDRKISSHNSRWKQHSTIFQRTTKSQKTRFRCEGKKEWKQIY